MTLYSKQTYVLVAEKLRVAREFASAHPFGEGQILAVGTVDGLIEDFAQAFRLDNPSFDESQFRRAAGQEYITGGSRAYSGLPYGKRSYGMDMYGRRRPVRVHSHTRG